MQIANCLTWLTCDFHCRHRQIPNADPERGVENYKLNTEKLKETLQQL